MGLYVAYRRLDQPGPQVVYQFGFDETQMDRRVLVSSTGQDIAAPPASYDPILAKVYGRVVSHYRTTGRWTGAGAIQS